jgi:hypothetical protein
MSTQANELKEMQSANERTQTITVMEKVVAVAENGEKTEVSNPKKVFIRPLSMRSWATALGYMTTVLGALPDISLDLDNPLQTMIWIGHVIGKIPDEIFGLLSLATGEPADLFDRIDLDEGITIAQAVVEVNKDFFVLRVLPMLSDLAPALKSKMESTLGQTQ